MANPYEILGVSPGATEEQVQEAYRVKSAALPMDNPSDPSVVELNSAYDQIILQLRGQSLEGFSADNTNTGSELEDIRYLLQAGRTEEAEELLNGIPESGRSAEWFFLKGTVFYNRGFIELAYENFQRATQMDPINLEYKSAFQEVSNFGKGSMPGNPYASSTDASCGNGADCCTTLLCLNCCLNCCLGCGS